MKARVYMTVDGDLEVWQTTSDGRIWVREYYFDFEVSGLVYSYVKATTQIGPPEKHLDPRISLGDL